MVSGIFAIRERVITPKTFLIHPQCLDLAVPYRRRGSTLDTSGCTDQHKITWYSLMEKDLESRVLKSKIHESKIAFQSPLSVLIF